jgi:predicted ATP-grasp superfamily ATP-dependent carboligase
VNPRWTASMELVEQARGVSMFALHAGACARGELPAFDAGALLANPMTHGKAIVFARNDVAIGDTRPWLEDSTVRDVPHEGERIAAGQPICTVFAAGVDDAECYARLVERAARLYRDLD